MKTNIVIFCLGLTLNSCSEVFSENDVKGEEAKVIFAGSEASDGCGWLLILSDEKKYKPESLSNEFKVDGLSVEVSFKELNSIYSCGFPSANSPKYKNVRITKIKKK